MFSSRENRLPTSRRVIENSKGGRANILKKESMN